MRVLLTNDDGFEAEGIGAVRAALTDLFDSVITVAPEADSSGFARRCTFSRPVAVTRVTGGRHPVYRCDGTPVDCVRAGLLFGLAAEADLVVSGINHGANLADDVVYSGTIGAGLEASVLGTPAICLSQQTPTGSFAVNYREDLARTGLAYDFSFAAAHGAQLVRAVIGARAAEPVVLSVNYPARRAADVSVLTRPGRRAYPRTAMPEWDGDVRLLYLFGQPDEDIAEADASPGTDIGALRAGQVSVTPLSSGASAADSSEAFQSFIARLTEAFPIASPAMA
ncbi:MAG TPA: 5'/3'-nucleotidase SurE [Streptosporangiaceae bacterium]|nr:5'/3'-nucleotidase SurE [Streptosporangiaceae bacterium]